MSVQNPYSLLCRTYEIGLSEISIRDKSGLLAYSPLAGGFLTGKHKRSGPEDGSRFTLQGGQGDRYLDRYWNDMMHDTVDALKPLAKQADITLAHLAVGWVLANPAITSPIVGATKPSQLDDAINAVKNPLTDDLVHAINEITMVFRQGDDQR